MKAGVIECEGWHGYALFERQSQRLRLTCCSLHISDYAHRCAHLGAAEALAIENVQLGQFGEHGSSVFAARAAVIRI